MKGTIKTLIAIAILSQFAQLNAQILPDTLQGKYWLYRDIYRKFYTRIGREAGKSLPAVGVSNQAVGGDGNVYGEVLYCDTFKISKTRKKKAVPATTPLPEYWNKLGFADVLAWEESALGTMATEYWLLTHAVNKDVESIKALENEIYYALFALDRVDEAAEKSYDKNYTGSLKNGFLLRDDVPIDFDKPTVKEYDYGHTWHGAHYTSGIWYIDTLKRNLETEYYGPDSFKLKRNQDLIANRENEMSQDQMIGVLTGFMFLYKFLPHTLEVDPDGPNGVLPKKNLISWQAEITDRMMKHITKMSYNIKMYDDETYFNKQKKKNRKRVEDGWYVSNNDPTDQISQDQYDLLPLQMHQYYSNLTEAHWPYTYVFNPVIADSANYVITNPALGDAPVLRGPFAFGFGYPLELIGEKLASANQSQPKDYPSVKVFPSQNIRNTITALNAPITGPIGFDIGNFATGIASVFATETTSQGQVDAYAISFGTGSPFTYCPVAFTAPFGNLEIFSQCVVGESFDLKEPNFWKGIWNSMGKDNAFGYPGFMKSIFINNDAGLTTNLMQWLIPVSGTWDHDKYKDFYDKCNQPLNEILYAVLNDKVPKKSISYYRSILKKAPMEGLSNFAKDPNLFPFQGDQIFKRNMDSTGGKGMNKLNGLQYTLMYNLVKIAEHSLWNLSPYEYSYSPIYPKTTQQYYQNAVFKNALGIDAYTQKVTTPKEGWVWNYRTELQRYANNKPVDTLNTLIPFPEYMDSAFQIRIPEVLANDYQVGKYLYTQDKIVLNVQYDLNVSNCLLKITDGGKVQTNVPKAGEMYHRIRLMNKATMQINQNSTLLVADNTKVIIDEESTLLYNKGAKIILNGPKAVLHIKGNLKLGPGAVFKIEGGSNGKGYVIWENNSKGIIRRMNASGSNTIVAYKSSANLIADTSNSMIFESTNNTELALECLGNLGLMTGWGPKLLEIKNCKIKFGPESRIVSEAKSTLCSNVNMEGFYDKHPNPKFSYKYTSMGFHILGRINKFENIKIQDCFIGLKLFNVGTYEPLILNNGEFYNCVKSILNEGGRIIYNGGNIYGDINMQRLSGIEGYATQGNTDINDVSIEVPNYQDMNNINYYFKPGEYCAALKYHGPARISTFKSRYWKADKGIEINQSSIRPVCSQIDLNNSQISIINYAGLNLANRSMNIINYTQTSAFSGYPRTSIRGFNNSMMFLSNAQNRITGDYNSGSHFVSFNTRPLVYLPASNTANTFFPNCLKGINAENNSWEILGANQDDVHSFNLNVGIGPNLTMQGYINGAHNYLDLHTKPLLDYTQFTDSSNHYCNLYQTHGGWYNTDPVSNSRWATPLDITNRPTVDIPKETQFIIRWVPKTLSEYVTQGDYNIYFNKARAALDTVINDTMLEPLVLLYSDFQSSYRNIMSDPEIPEANRPALENQYYNTLLDIQNSLITRSYSADQPYRYMRMELNRDLALIHRSFNHRAEGISHLNSVVNDFPNPDDRAILNSWICILTREQMYLDSIITYDSVYLHTCLPEYYFDDSSHNFLQLGFDPWLFNQNNQEGGNNGGTPNPSGLDLPATDKKEPTSSILTLFPNPAENSYTIVCNEAMFNIKVTDNTGRVIQTLKANGQKSLLIDASNYSRGIYFVEAYGTDKRFVQRLLINK